MPLGHISPFHTIYLINFILGCAVFLHSTNVKKKFHQIPPTPKIEKSSSSHYEIAPIARPFFLKLFFFPPLLFVVSQKWVPQAKKHFWIINHSKQKQNSFLKRTKLCEKKRKVFFCYFYNEWARETKRNRMKNGNGKWQFWVRFQFKNWKKRVRRRNFRHCVIFCLYWGR